MKDVDLATNPLKIWDDDIVNESDHELDVYVELAGEKVSPTV